MAGNVYTGAKCLLDLAKASDGTIFVSMNEVKKAPRRASVGAVFFGLQTIQTVVEKSNGQTSLASLIRF